MKRAGLLLAIGLIFLWNGIPVFGAEAWREDAFGTAGELYAGWKEDYPDYLCGVWTENGGSVSLTFGVVAGAEGEKGKAEILRLIRDDSTVTFVVQKYSRRELLAIMEELHPAFEEDKGLLSLGLMERENCIEVGLFKERREDPVTLAFAETLVSQYGDAITIRWADEITNLTAQPAGPERFFAFFLLGMAFLLLAGLARQRRRSLQPLPETGGWHGRRSSLRRIEDAITESVPLPSPALDERILEELARRKKQKND